MAVERQSAYLPPAQPSYILRGHASQIHSVQFARQNTRLITGDADGWIIYWKLETKRALAVWKAHDGAILGTAAWAHDKIITHGRDNNLRIWQIRAADESALSTALPAEVPSGDRATPWLLHTLPVNTLNFCAFSACEGIVQGKAQKNENTIGSARSGFIEDDASVLIAVPARDDKKAEVYQFPEERLKYVVPRAQSKDTGMVMALKLVRNSTAQQTLVVTGYEGGLTAVHLLPKDDDSVIGIAQLVYLSQPHTQPILSLDVSPDAEMYFTSGADAIIAAHRIPDLPSRPEDENLFLRVQDDEDDPPISIPKPSPEIELQTASSGTVGGGTKDLPVDDPPISIPDDTSPGEPFSFSKRPIATSVQPGLSSRGAGGLSSLLSNAATPLKTSKTAPPPLLSVQAPYKVNNTKHAGQQSLSVRSDGRLLVTGGWDSRVRVYSAKTLKEVAVLKWHKEGVYAVAFAAILVASDLHQVAGKSNSGETSGEVTNKETGLGKLQRHREEKMQVKHWIAAGAKDGKVSLWELF
ncbi:WD40-repeat-containing domain protein [Boeremia exigua]|uniref:WD40-repeat-containing domain protein n=1 Tax=Boeremia exigua TaxID=749465 RepID=UPI001E8ED52A|nr:WD40-repeat-containing domain protein [Boeremia exigua]KAH6614044.1 WD40-repeat-containing domain protein [Boeremia exigua]